MLVSGAQFKVASYNVRNLFDNIDDPGKDDEGTQPKSQESQNSLGRVIRSSDADVIALQEVEKMEILRSFRDGQGLAEEYPHLVLVEGNDRRGIDVALMSKHPISGVVSHKDTTFEVEGQEEPGHFLRDLLQADVEVPGAGPVRMFVTHLCSQIGGDQADRLREAEAQAAHEIIKEQTRDFPSQKFVVLGDFNDRPESPAVSIFTEPDDAGWSLVDAFASEPDAVSYPTNPKTARKWGYKRIDQILVSPELAQHQVDQDVHEHRSARKASDHWMVSATFELPQSS